jgi:hypothetical protein
LPTSKKSVVGPINTFVLEASRVKGNAEGTGLFYVESTKENDLMHAPIEMGKAPIGKLY